MSFSINLISVSLLGLIISELIDLAVFLGLRRVLEKWRLISTNSITRDVATLSYFSDTK